MSDTNKENVSSSKDDTKGNSIDSSKTQTINITDTYTKFTEDLTDTEEHRKKIKKIVKENKEKFVERKRLRLQKKQDAHEKMRVENNRVSFFTKLKNWWPLSKTAGKIFLIYVAIVLIGGSLLSIPGVVNSSANSNWNLITGIFTASSAFSDTGISILIIRSDYSIWGQIIILILIQIGGVGILTLKVLLLMLFRARVTYETSSSAYTERGNGSLNRSKDMIFFGIIFLFVTEFIGAFLLFFAFFFIHAQDPNTDGITGIEFTDFYKKPLAIWAALFHSISATNNAGFDIISNSSLLPYNQNHWAYFIQIIFMFQWIVGGLGFPTFYDIKRKIAARKAGQRVRFSLFTKLNFVVYLVLFVIGPLLVYLSELSSGIDSQILYVWRYTKGYLENNMTRPPLYSELLGSRDSISAFMNILFNTTSCRNAGFSTVDINNFNGGSKIILSVLMFIGSAPSSTAGGIRTTTFAILILEIWAIMRSQKEIYVFKKRIPQETVKRSLAVFFISFILVFITVFVVYTDSYDVINVPISDEIQNNGAAIDGGDKSIPSLITIITSAFGTVGLNPFTSGVNSQMWHLGVLSKIMLILLMFIGQLGISNTLLVFVKPGVKKQIAYLDEDVMIG
ncbi:potassium transporter TrkG [Spiroplasma endosymbiont of Labia minor]|uniref:potassium transporter TrkG n=1 Tax=Spiroplasma endosymbiont of Labia minor TaxID=3066305 RepID=UPI0030D2C2E7